jgi:cell division protein FtsW
MANKAAQQVRGHQPDYILALTVFALLVFGLIMIYSISPVLSFKLLNSTSRNYYFYGQLFNIAAGLVAWTVGIKVYYQRWNQLSGWLMAAAIGLLAILFIPGLSNSTNGATRWLQLGPVSFQPAEFLKLASILYLATWFERRRDELKTFWDGMFPFGVMLGVASFVLVVLQRDMGTMMVLVAASLGIYLIAGAPWRHFAGLVAAGGFLGWLSIITFPHRLDRLQAFLHPNVDPTGVGYHISQALIAVGSGGILGRGLGNSLQIYGYLPEAANDSIFAVIGEEFGFIGALVILALFCLLVSRGLKIARQAPDVFSRLVAAGITLWLGAQALINIAAMLSLVPLTGIPLPFISYGGSSLIMALGGVGILLNISKYTVKEVANADSRQRGRNSGSYYANLGRDRRAKVAR